MLDGMAGMALSVPDRMATLGSALPSAWARPTALLTISIRVFSLGATLTAPSVIISTRSDPGTVIWNTWLRRRPVRSPVSRATTAAIRASVWTWPFIRALTSPSRASATAARAAALSSSPPVSTMRKPEMSQPMVAARLSILSRLPTRTGVIRPASVAWRALSMTTMLSAPATAMGTRARPRARSSRYWGTSNGVVLSMVQHTPKKRGALNRGAPEKGEGREAGGGCRSLPASCKGA